METINQRRSIRKYSAKDVPPQLLDALLRESERTQTMGNLQLYSVVVTRSAEGKQRLSPAHFGQPMVTEAPVVLTFCADFRRTSSWCKTRKAEPGYSNFLSFINAATDALLYCQTFCTLAEEAGLGLCFLGTTVYMPQAIIEALSLPRLVMPVATITLGYPAERPPQSDRLPLEAIVHEEYYADYTPDLIDRYYGPKEQLPENLRFLEINHKETLAQIFTDIRYTRRDNEAISTTLIQALRQQGFLE
jgi:FMN reductase [NAD(P)H]